MSITPNENQNNSSHSSLGKNLDCPICKGNSTLAIGKGYSYLFAVVMVAFLFLQSIEFHSSKERGFEVNSRDVPLGLTIFSGLLICGALGINTDPIAEKIGHLLSK